MSERAGELFAEYADAYVRGERPSSSEYLARAGDEADALAGLIDRYVAAAPASSPDDVDVALVEAWLGGKPPLLELRVGRGLKASQVVDAVVGSLKLDPAKREKVRRYYHELETGLLEPRGVDRRVWEALAEALRALAREPMSLRQQPMRTEPAVYYRAPESAALASAPAAAAPPPEEDEIDRLFRGGGSPGTSV